MTRSSSLKRARIFLLLQFLAVVSFAQDHPSRKAIVWADSLYRALENSSINDPVSTKPLLDSMMHILRATHDPCRMARVQAWRGRCFDAMGQIDSAVAACQRAQGLFRGDCDSLILMSIQVNMGNALLSLGEVQRVRELSETSLNAWNESWPYSPARNGLLTNRAIAMAGSGDLESALDAFRDVLQNARKEGKRKDQVDALTNLGVIFGILSDSGRVGALLDSSGRYQRAALTLSKGLNDPAGVLSLYFNLAFHETDRYHFQDALAYLDSAQTLADDLGNLDMSTSIAWSRSDIFARWGSSDSAYRYLRIHLTLKDSLLNTEKVKAIAEMREKYESEKSAKEILELKAANLEGELRQARVRRTRNIYLFSGIGVLLLAAALWSRLRFVHRSRAAIQKEKEISEGLLHNILPVEVAAELKAKGHADVRQFEQATILFTDFKGFTSLSEKLSPPELVAEIDHCFKAFDGIMGRYGIEKIKTIGDAYMAAGGLPIPGNGRPLDVVRAALDMQVFMAAYKAERQKEGRLYFEMRVGLHTGTVIAGIVGVKKFAYDIWGDTVNTASRMESSGEVGRVNISEHTYQVVKGEPGLTFISRGKVQAKGKGEMEMYFVDAV